MMPRICWASIAGFALLVVAAPCLAADPPPPAEGATTGDLSGKGGIGGLVGGSYFYGAGDYSDGALPRFDFAGQFRYVFSPRFRLQVSPGFTWSGYSKTKQPPFVDPAHPDDASKESYLTLLTPVSAQAQLTWGSAKWHWHVGVGPGVYRVLVENHRKVLKDPATYRKHQGNYFGMTSELGVERFLKSLRNTSVELSLADHLVFATRDEQFPSGWNSNLGAIGLRLGANYYFSPGSGKKAEPPLPAPTK